MGEKGCWNQMALALHLPGKDTTTELQPPFLVNFDIVIWGLESVLKVGRISRREKYKYLSAIYLCQALPGVQ